ncbi:hypothetical protein C8Q74DRAFT_511055 [Fomes fomentarius]|nr:hypothetical protein C8Q74DRAFT_511055 [Fomes fomentarius]
MLDAQALFLEYPLRPAQLLPSSPAVDALRARLNGAPSRKGAIFGDPVPGLVYNDGGFNGDPAFYEWGDEFTSGVYHALDDVIKAHGMGAEGWANVRWEVYDQYVKSVGGGPWHTRDCNRLWHWVDDAKRWLKKDDLMRGLSKYCSTAA